MSEHETVPNGWGGPSECNVGWGDLPLAEHHIKALVQSGIPADIAQARGYQTIGDDDIALLGGLEPTPFGRRARHAGLLVPTHGVTGGIVGHQLRPDAEVINPKSGDVMKYLTPYGENSVIDCPPTMLDRLRDLPTPLLITEGSKKADSAAARGLLCVALRGVDNWTSGQGTALEDWRDIQLLGRRVGICYDSDLLEKKAVRGAAKRLSKYLTRRGADVHFIVLPGYDDGRKRGLDDWLVDFPDGDPWDVAITRLPDFAEEADTDKTPVLATDLDLADTWVARHGDDFRYVRETEKWLGYNGTRWDAEGGITLARASFQDMIRTVAPYTEKYKDGDVLHLDATPWMRQAGRIQATLTQAAANRTIHTSIRVLDLDPHLFNLGNGTYDLRRHVFLPHDPDHLITLGSTVDYDAEAEAPHFMAFLEDILPEPETRQFVQRVLGQAMIGTVTEHIFPVFQGTGRNGKGTLLRLVQAAFGTYYSGISKSLLIVKAHEEHATVIASLHRRRLVTAQEVGESDVWNAAMIKELVGGDDLTGRYMREDEFTFTPSHTLIMAANHWPKVSAKDEAFWARVKKIPFNRVFERPDDRVEQRMKQELPGILNWLIAGARDYQTHGLGEPAQVLAATAGIRAESDPLQQFLSEYVQVTHDPLDQVSLSELYDHWYTTWHRNTRERSPMVPRNKFGAEVASALGIEPPRKLGKGNVTTFTGIRLIDGSGNTDGDEKTDPFGGPVGEPIDKGKFAVSSPSSPPSSPTGPPAADTPAEALLANSPANSANSEANSPQGVVHMPPPGKANSANSANSLFGGIDSESEKGGNPVTWSTSLPTSHPFSPISNERRVSEFAEFADSTNVDGLANTESDDRAALFAPEAAPYERLAPADYVAAATEALPDDVVVFDIESHSGEKVFTTGPEFVKIFGYQAGDKLRVTEDVAEMVDLVLHSKKLVGHNIMNFDLLPFALHHGLDIHQAAADGRLWDTQLVEVLLNPPPYWMEPKRVPSEYRLDKLGQEKFGVGKSHDLTGMVKKHSGAVAKKGEPGTQFEIVPNDDAEYVKYCAADVDLTARIGRSQRHTPAQGDYIRREHRIAAIAAQVSINGFKVDVDLLQARYAEGQRRKEEMKEKLRDQYGATFRTAKGEEAHGLTPGDRAAVERAFNTLGVELPRSAKGGGPATNKDVLNELRGTYGDRPEVLDLIDTVQGYNGVRTVYGTTLAHLHPDGRVHPMINMYQSTGRWSVQNPGLTVFGKRLGKYTEREIFIPDEGEVIIAADLSQVDARAIAAWCQDPEYMKMFAPGMDLHAEVAFQMFGDRGRRDDAKALSHGYNYGLGFNKLAKAHGADLARSFLDTMQSQFERLVGWKDEIRRESAENGYRLDNGWGKPLVIDPDSNFTQAPALVGQSAARDIMMEGLLRLPRWVLPMLRVQVHDEIVLSVPEDRVDEIKAIVVDAMSFPWRPFNGKRGHERTVEILADSGKPGKNWGQVYEK
jgi:DNA polymerase-1